MVVDLKDCGTSKNFLIYVAGLDVFFSYVLTWFLEINLSKFLIGVLYFWRIGKFDLIFRDLFGEWLPFLDLVLLLLCLSFILCDFAKS